MPLLAPAIPAAVRAQRELLGASEYSRQALARRLKRDITVGYLRWLVAMRNQGIVDASVALLNENLRVNESLFRNGKITQDQVLRARAELLQVTQQSRDAQNLAAQAQSYLNFLMNRSLDTALENAEIAAEVTATTRALAELRQAAIDNRPELAELDAPDTRQRSADQRRESRSLADAVAGRRWRHPGRGIRIRPRQQLLHRFAAAQLDVLRRRRAPCGGAPGGRQRAPHRDAVRGTRPSRCSSKYSSRSTGSTPAPIRSPPPPRAPRPRAPRFRIASRKRDEGVISQVEFIDARSSSHRRRAQSQCHAFRSARAPGRARLRHCRGHLAAWTSA